MVKSQSQSQTLTWHNFRKIIKNNKKENWGNQGSDMQPPSCKIWKFNFFEKIKNTKPSLSPLSSHFGILAKGRGSSATQETMADEGFQTTKMEGFHGRPGHTPSPSTEYR
jgi:hypothetical protein